MSGSGGWLVVSGTGSCTGTDWILASERVKRTKVASRKKMTSIRGMISMRAFFFPSSPLGLASAMAGWVGRVWVLLKPLGLHRCLAQALADPGLAHLVEDVDDRGER